MREGTDGAKIHEEKSPNSSRANSWNTASAVHHHSQSIRQPPARWFTPNVMDHRVWPSTEASQILKLLRIGGVQDHSGHPGTSQPLTSQPPFWKATLQDLADTEPIHTNIELVSHLTTILRHDKLAISTPLQARREETVEVINDLNEVQVARTAGWVFHPILLETSTVSPNAKGADIRTYFTLLQRNCTMAMT